MPLPPILVQALFVVLALASVAAVGWLFGTAVRRPLKPLEVAAGAVPAHAAYLLGGIVLFKAASGGEYAALGAVGAAVAFPLLSEMFGIYNLVRKERMARQTTWVRIILQMSLNMAGVSLTFALWETLRRALNVARADGLIMLASGATLAVLIALAFLLVRVQPLNGAEKRFRLGAARRMIVARANLLAINNLGVYFLLRLGIGAGDGATLLLIFLFLLNGIAGSALGILVDEAALNPALKDGSAKRLVEASQNADKDAVHLSTREAKTTQGVPPVEPADVQIVNAPMRR